MKRGRLRGTIWRTPSGRTVFLAVRRQEDMIRSGEKTCSDAVRKESAGWGLDEGVAIDLRARGVEYAGVVVRGTNDKYLAPIDAWFDHTRSLPLYNPRYASQRCLPLSAFGYRQGRTKL